MRNRSCKLNFNSEHFQNSTQKRAFVELWLWFPSFLVDFQGCSAHGITDTAARECAIGCRHGGKLKNLDKIHQNPWDFGIFVVARLARSTNCGGFLDIFIWLGRLAQVFGELELVTWLCFSFQESGTASKDQVS